MRPVLLVPGIGNSGPGHWQSLWQAKHSHVDRVMQRDWDHPVCNEWVETLDQAVEQAAAPPILVAHSLGCLTVAHWAARSDRPCFAVLLVAVPNPGGPDFPRVAIGFGTVPPALREHRVTVVSSDDDPYATTAYTEEQVALWGAEHVRLSQGGHINALSGLGDWPDGWAIVERWRNGCRDRAIRCP
ncbi:MAG: alpha/beta fold hydrolase [Pseudomonadota bacterium]|nr:alpha/beta fold hydrolase [Pseudomonadota bacterium]